MKLIRYKFLSCEEILGTEEAPAVKKVFFEKTLAWNEANEALAKQEAYNGVYTIEDDGQPERFSPTHEQRITELEEALELILSEVTE